MSIFQDPNETAREILRDRLVMLASAQLPETELSPEYVAGKLRAAEATIQRLLKVFFVPTKVLPEDVPQAEIDALEAAETPYFQEANYDYDANFFAGDRWGDIYLHQKPVISIDKVQIAYPFAGVPAYDIPVEWIRVDRKYGLLRLIPVSSLIASQMASLRMQLLSAGRMMPFSIRLHYTAGLKNAERDYPDLLEVIKKKTVLLIVEDMFLPTSGSISADGLSQSLSTDMSKYDDMIESKLFGGKGSNGGLFAAIHGIQLGVL